MKNALFLGAAALLLTAVASVMPTAAQAQHVEVVVSGCGPQGRECAVSCPKDKHGKQLLLSVAVCNNHGKPGAQKPEYGVGGEVMPVYTSGISAKCVATNQGFGDSMYGVCVAP